MRRWIATIALIATPAVAQGRFSGTLSGADNQSTAPAAWTPRSLGTVTPSGLPSTNVCSQVVAGRTCYTVTVSGCSGVSESVDAEIRVADKSGSGGADRTALLVAGGTGATFYNGASGSVPQTSADSILRANGFRTVEVRFLNPAGHAANEDGWTIAASGVATGRELLACRAATLFNWVNTNLKFGSLMCATGNSIGSAALAYSMGVYGLETLFDQVVLSSGPPNAKQDMGCAQASLTGGLVKESSYGTTGQGKQNVDQAYGYFTGDSNGPCSANQAAYLAQFQNDGNDSDHGDYFFNHTEVDFQFGDIDSIGGCSFPGDCTNAPNHGKRYYYRLIGGGQILISTFTHAVGQNVGHTIQATATGADKVNNTLNTGCVDN